MRRESEQFTGLSGRDRAAASSQHPVPLLEFVTRLADEADNKQALRQWVDEEAQRLNLTDHKWNRSGKPMTCPPRRSDRRFT